MLMLLPLGAQYPFQSSSPKIIDSFEHKAFNFHPPRVHY